MPLSYRARAPQLPCPCPLVTVRVPLRCHARAPKLPCKRPLVAMPAPLGYRARATWLPCTCPLVDIHVPLIHRARASWLPCTCPVGWVQPGMPAHDTAVTAGDVPITAPVTTQAKAANDVSPTHEPTEHESLLAMLDGKKPAASPLATPQTSSGLSSPQASGSHLDLRRAPYCFVWY